jgi:hypothetical protein
MQRLDNVPIRRRVEVRPMKHSWVEVRPMKLYRAGARPNDFGGEG